MRRARLDRTLRVTLVGMVVNTLLAGAKIIAGIAGHSHALVADGVESLADLFSSVIVWRGLIIAAEPADEDHPYGHGKAEPIAAAMVATLLLLASIWIVVVGVREIVRPDIPPAPFTLIVLLVVVVVKECLFRFVLREAASVESSAVHADAWHHRSDAITSLAAGIGIAVALAGYEVADDLAAIVAALVIAWNGRRLLRGALDELMDTSPSREVVSVIRGVAATVPGVQEVEKCIVRKMGYHYFVDMHVEVNPQMSVARAHEIAHEVKDKVRERLPKVSDVLVHIEPAGRRRKPKSGN